MNPILPMLEPDMNYPKKNKWIDRADPDEKSDFLLIVYYRSCSKNTQTRSVENNTVPLALSSLRYKMPRVFRVFVHFVNLYINMPKTQPPPHILVLIYAVGGCACV